MESQKVIYLHNNVVGQDILTFFDQVEDKSVKTRVNYERSIRNFFLWYKEKDIQYLLEEDLKVRNADIVKYRKYLIKGGADNTEYKNSTINNYMSAIPSLYTFLERNGYDVKSEHTELDPLEEETNKHAELNQDEAKAMCKYVINTKKGYEKSMLIRLAYTTGFRKSELLNLTFQDIRKHREHDFYLVHVRHAKAGKSHTMPISSSLYESLIKIKELKYYGRYEDTKIFHLSKTTIQAMMVDLRTKLDFYDEDNGVVFHSLRNVIAGFIEEQGGSAVEIKEALNQSSLDVAHKSYMHKNKDYSNIASLKMEEEIGDDIFCSLSREELMKIVESQSGMVLAHLKKSAKNIIDKREN